MEQAPVRRFALDVIRSWPGVAREAAHHVILVHRAPHVVEPETLQWHGIGPWERVTVSAREADPDQVVESVVKVAIPGHRRADVDAVADEFRIRVEEGDEIVVRRGDLARNVITLNVLHELLEGTLSPDEAIDHRRRDLADLRAGRPPASAATCRFADDAPHGEPRAVGRWRLASERRLAGTRRS
jgi:hypothetical protein